MEQAREVLSHRAISRGFPSVVPVESETRHPLLNRQWLCAVASEGHFAEVAVASVPRALCGSTMALCLTAKSVATKRKWTLFFFFFFFWREGRYKGTQPKTLPYQGTKTPEKPKDHKPIKPQKEDKKKRAREEKQLTAQRPHPLPSPIPE